MLLQQCSFAKEGVEHLGEPRGQNPFTEALQTTQETQHKKKESKEWVDRITFHREEKIS